MVLTVKRHFQGHGDVSQEDPEHSSTTTDAPFPFPVHAGMRDVKNLPPLVRAKSVTTRAHTCSIHATLGYLGKERERENERERDRQRKR